MKTLLFTVFTLLFHFLQAQNYSVLAENLRLPVGIEIDAQQQIWVTESGYGFDDGGVSLVQQNGTILPVIVGLPSLFDTTNQEGVGPWHTLMLPGNRMAVTEGATGQVLFYDLSGFVPGMSSPMTLSDTIASMDIAGFVSGQGILESDPYSLAADAAGNLYVADAAANAVIKITGSGEMSVFATLPAFPNPLPFGPPMVDAVPTRILAKPAGGFYLCQLTGFPFLDGTANVYSLDLNGVVTPYATGLATLTDMALDAATGNLYALQIGHFVLDPMLPPGFAPNSAQVTRISPNGDRVVVAQNFDLSPGVALDAAGNLYTSEIGSGRILKWSNITTGTLDQEKAAINFSLTPNPTFGETKIAFSLAVASTVKIQVLDVSGQVISAENLGRMNAGDHQTDWQAGKISPGVYWVDIQTEQGHSVLPLIVK